MLMERGFMLVALTPSATANVALLLLAIR